ncbi:hypothetical protein TNCT_396061 [Trichonephila clavata]|uniref:Uncharacterized protein n=1 Tax=Trichonephila clavata TaxID=2740835 RepID=A0A8X6LVF3_TRICU|nr:hypothetical protein TNCT_396061 [Trichonephila clavata]
MDTQRHPCPYRDSYWAALRISHSHTNLKNSLQIRQRVAILNYHANLREDRYPRAVPNEATRLRWQLLHHQQPFYCAHLNRATASFAIVYAYLPLSHPNGYRVRAEHCI